MDRGLEKPLVERDYARLIILFFYFSDYLQKFYALHRYSPEKSCRIRTLFRWERLHDFRKSKFLLLFLFKGIFSIQDYATFNQLFNKIIVFLQFCIAMNNIEHVCQCVMTVPHEFSFYEDRMVLTVVKFQSL